MALSGLKSGKDENKSQNMNDQLIAPSPYSMRRFSERYVLACTAACIAETGKQLKTDGKFN
jgi:hypothetical protein